MKRVTAGGSSGVGGLDVASIVCPACGVSAGSWCVRHGQIQAGPSLACVARVRAARSAVVCPECKRAFDLFNETDTQEWYYGHDCEVVGGDIDR